VFPWPARHNNTLERTITLMDPIKSKLKEELEALYKEGVEIYMAEYHRKKEPESKKKAVKKTRAKKDDAETEKKKPNLHFGYQSWYSKALPVVRQLLPERYREFQDQYKLEKRKDNNIDFLTYTISDYLVGISVTRGYYKEEVVNPFSAFSSKYQHQLTILASAKDRIDSLLANIEGVLQTELFRHELDAADDLLKKKHLRAAGALAGVSLETHLGRVCANHNVPMPKKAPTISDFNEALKAATVLDVPTWRHVQRLGDIRNLCVHAKEREPTTDEVTDLISGTRKILATIF